ncbi:MAG: PIG-L family deacetylase [Elusimicrobia bacterium]|nr:PIG-L family deacetylase [Elusimicrobiota bacterium]
MDLTKTHGAAAAAPAARRPFHQYAGRTVLALGAHPDDLELGIGGTLASLALAGAKVVGAVVSVPNQHETRRAEAQTAAEIVGMSELRFLLDNGVRIEDLKAYELVELIERLIRDSGPALMLSHGTSDFHRDHVLVHNACVEASRVAFFDFFTYFPTMTRPVAVDFFPRVYVDISHTIETKMRAIDAYPSQFQRRELETEFCRAQAREHGRRVGVQYAEAMQVVRMRLS